MDSKRLSPLRLRLPNCIPTFSIPEPNELGITTGWSVVLFRALAREDRAADRDTSLGDGVAAADEVNEGAGSEGAAGCEGGSTFAGAGSATGSGAGVGCLGGSSIFSGTAFGAGGSVFGSSLGSSTVGGCEGGCEGSASHEEACVVNGSSHPDGWDSASGSLGGAGAVAGVGAGGCCEGAGVGC